jgi:pentose-5-phosphate-3-epimerase
MDGHEGIEEVDKLNSLIEKLLHIDVTDEGFVDGLDAVCLALDGLFVQGKIDSLLRIDKGSEIVRIMADNHRLLLERAESVRDNIGHDLSRLRRSRKGVMAYLINGAAKGDGKSGD